MNYKTDQFNVRFKFNNNIINNNNEDDDDGDEVCLFFSVSYFCS